MVSTFESKVIRLQKLTLSLILIELELINPQTIEFKSGQYIAITLPDNKGIRSYSVSSSELKKKSIELTINVFDFSLGGDGVNYLSNLKLGDTVIFKGPFGRLNLIDSKVILDNKLDPTVTEIIWIGTGSGIAPIKSMLEYVNYISSSGNEGENLRNLKNALYVGARYSGDICYFDTFKSVENNNPNFKFSYCLSKIYSDEDQGYTDIDDHYKFKGYVTQKILDDTKDYYIRSHIHVFACGKTSTIQSVLKELSENGFDRTKFHIENYG